MVTASLNFDLVINPHDLSESFQRGLISPINVLSFPSVGIAPPPYGGEIYIIQDRPMESRLPNGAMCIDHDKLISGCLG